MADLIENGQFTSVSGGVGTTVVKDFNTVLKRVVFGGTYVGTLNLHDASSAAGTTGSSQIISFGLPTTTIPNSVEIGVRCRNGLVYQATGTPVCTIVWE